MAKKASYCFHQEAMQHIFVTVIKKIKIASVHEKQWEICKEEPTGTFNFRIDFE